jgi:glutamate--cysteine ligase
VCSSFLRGMTDHHLVPFDESSKSLHTPYGTALRMGDLGYSSNAQKNLSICYNSLDAYIETLQQAITEPHPEYEAIGVGEDGQERQLNTSLLQIENEFYSLIRPKRVANSGETALGALRRDGIEYIEVRCVDVSPFHPLGIDAEQIRFIDTFLLYCLLSDSADCDDEDGERIAENLQRVVNRGREPGLTLTSTAGEVPLSSMAGDLLDGMQAIADAQDAAAGDDQYRSSHSNQRAKVKDPGLTPSAQILQQMEEQNLPFFRLAMKASKHWAQSFRDHPLDPDRARHFEDASQQSLQGQAQMDDEDDVDFQSYLAAYYRQYDAL